MKKAVWCLMFLMFLAIPPALFSEKTKIGVLTFASKGGVSQSESSTITDIFCVELVNSGIFDVLDRAKMDEILKEQAFQSSGCTEAECVVRIGKIVNMEKMVYGTVSKLGTKLFITINSVDVETGRVEHAAKTSMETMDEVEGTMGSLISEFTGIAAQKSGTASLKTVSTANRNKYFPQITKLDDTAVEIDSTTRDQMLSVGQACDVLMFNRSRSGKVEAITLGQVVIKGLSKSGAKAEIVAGFDTISPGDYLNLAPINPPNFWATVGATMVSPTWGASTFKGNVFGIVTGAVLDTASVFFLLDVLFSTMEKGSATSTRYTRRGLITRIYYSESSSQSDTSGLWMTLLYVLGGSIGSHIPFALINGITSIVNSFLYDGFIQENAPLPAATVKTSLVPGQGIKVALSIPY